MTENKTLIAYGTRMGATSEAAYNPPMVTIFMVLTILTFMAIVALFKFKPV